MILPKKFTALDCPGLDGGPVYQLESTDSTMTEARVLSEAGCPDGTVITALFQSAGRGRVDGRTWVSRSGEALLCTVILRRPAMSGFTLRVGLAVAKTVEYLIKQGQFCSIKWPNDVLVDGRKIAGILCEGDGRTLYIGTGINVKQTGFPDDLQSKATSIAALTGSSPEPLEVMRLYLAELSAALDPADSVHWRQGVTERLWRLGQTLSFRSGDPVTGADVTGVLSGIGESGELLLRVPESAAEKERELRLFSGEIPY